MRRTTTVLALGALALTGCSEDPSDVSGGELVGLWGAISMVYTSHADPSLSENLLDSRGATYSLRLYPDDTYTTQLSGHSVPTVEESGTYEVRDRQMLLTPTGGSQRTLDLSFNGALLTLTEADTAWDFDDDGTPQPASLELVLDRF